MTRRRWLPESVYCECCGGTIVECGCTWRGDYCMKHAQRCPRERPQEPKKLKESDK